MSNPKLTWHAPRWSYTKKMWAGLKHVLNMASLIRITIGTAAISAVLIAGLKWAVPQFLVPNLWPFVLAFPSIVLLLVLQFGLLTLIPPAVTIRPDKLLVQHGQTATVIDTKSVTATCLTFHSEDRIRLRIFYSQGSKKRSPVIGVPPTVDFDRLAEMLPVEPVVRDARHRSCTFLAELC